MKKTKGSLLSCSTVLSISASAIHEMNDSAASSFKKVSPMSRPLALSIEHNQVQRTVVPTKYPGKDKEGSSGGNPTTTKGRTVRFRSICEEFDVTPSRESSPVCDIDRETLPVGSAAFQQILRELHISEDSADDSVSSETDSAQSSTESKPKRSILKVKMMRSRKQPRKGSVKK